MNFLASCSWQTHSCFISEFSSWFHLRMFKLQTEIETGECDFQPTTIVAGNSHHKLHLLKVILTD